VALLTPVPKLTLTPSAPLAGMYPEVRGEGFLPNTWTRLSMDGVGTSRSWRTTTSGLVRDGPAGPDESGRDASGAHRPAVRQRRVGRGRGRAGVRRREPAASSPAASASRHHRDGVAELHCQRHGQRRRAAHRLADEPARQRHGPARLGEAHHREAVDLEGRGPLRVEGQTSEIRCVNRTSIGIVRLVYGTHGIEWRGGAITGANPYPGRRQAETYEHNHAFDVRGVVGLDIGGVRIRNVGGDFFYLAGGYMPGGSFRHSQDVRIHDNDAQGNGRMGVAMLDGLDGFEIWDNVMGGITWYSLDIENNGHIFNNIPAGVTSGKIHNNKFGPIPYGRNPQLAPLPGISSEPTGLSFTVTGASSGGVVIPVSNIDVSYNENTDPAWPDFRWGIYTSGTSAVNVHDNVRQVKR
jgi:hypothetical protein